MKKASEYKPKVYVGMSGGVDSSVSAALLLQAGYDVTGVFIQVWQPDWLTCTWKEERRDAMRVAAHLNIPFVTLNLEKEYKQEVVDYMISEYKAGRTPNPDVMCNKYVKFGAFYDWAMKQGADMVATGHYARIHHDSNTKKETPYELRVSKDVHKDQSYFLWTLRTEQLPHILFPVGDLTKPEVRTLATTYKLPTAEKKDSQGLCFIGMVDMKEFLSHYIETNTGNVLNEKGEIIGTHQGALLFTLGERHGFTITKKTSQDTPYYVVGKDIEKNTITVAHSIRDTVPDNTKSVTIRETNWIGSVPHVGITYEARGRYRQKVHPIVFEHISTDGSRTARLTFKNAEDILSPGQSLVIYDGDICLGGGILV